MCLKLLDLFQCHLIISLFYYYQQYMFGSNQKVVPIIIIALKDCIESDQLMMILLNLIKFNLAIIDENEGL